MSKLFSGSEKSTSSSSTQYPAWITPELKKLVSKSTALTEQPYQAYTGERVAQLSPDEQQAFDLVRQLTGQAQPAYGQAQNIATQVAQRGLGGYTPEMLAPYLNPYQTQVMDISKLRQQQEFEKAKRGLAEQQAQIGSYGGSRTALAEQELYKNYAQQLAEQEAKQLYQGYGDAMSRAMSGTQMAGGAAGQIASLAGAGQEAELQRIGALQGIGGVQRDIGQAGLDVGYQDYLTAQQYPYNQLQFQAGMIEPIAGMTGTQTSTSKTTSSPSIAGTALGLASMAAAPFGGFQPAMTALGGLTGTNLGGIGAFNVGALGKSMQGPTMGGAPTKSTYGLGSYFGFKEGGKVPDMMKYEENDLPSKIDGFAEMMLAGSSNMGGNDPILDAPMYPDGPTRRQMMRVWQQQGLGDYELGAGYIEGGMVKRCKEGDYSCGEHVYGMPPMGTPSTQAGYACGGKVEHYEDGGNVAYGPNLPARSRWEEMFSFSPAEKARRAAFSREHPSGISVLGRYLSDPAHPSLSEAQQQLITERSNPKPAPEVAKKVEAMTAALGVAPKKAKATAAVSPDTEATGPTKDTMNLPLFAFGASLLGSNKNFFQALGEAGKSYATTKMTQQEAIEKAAQDALNRKLEERRVAAYERQTALGEAKLKIQAAKQKLQAGDPTMTKLVTELTKANPMGKSDEILLKASELSKGIAGTTSTEDVVTPSNIVKYDLQGNRI